MTSFIIISKDKTKLQKYLDDFYKKHGIDQFDITVIEKQESASSIGIEDIKNMQKKLFLKPIKSKTKVVAIQDSQILTIEAQNALLKVLEEPPANTLIILSADSKETLLPTIISRCKVIELQQEALKLSEKEKEEFEIFLQEFPRWGIGERLKKAEALAKDKDKALEWLGKLILVAREKLISFHSERSEESQSQDPSSGKAETQDDELYFNLLKSFQTLHTTLKTTNVNPRLAIETTLLSTFNLEI